MGILDDLTQANCTSCCWWQKDERLHGECHHGSPMGNYDPETGKFYGAWPLTDAHDSCGSHQFRGAQP
jgi:hypothetical protein